MASPSTGAGILLTGPTSTPDRVEKSDGGQLAESVQNGTWHPPMASQESLASRGASTEASAEAAVEFADQNTMQGPISDQQNIAHTEDQQLLEAAMTPLPASPVTATISTPSKSSPDGVLGSGQLVRTGNPSVFDEG